MTGIGGVRSLRYGPVIEAGDAGSVVERPHPDFDSKIGWMKFPDLKSMQNS